MARPLKLTPRVSKRITDALRAGNYLTTAAAAAGVSERTLHSWIARGEAADEIVGMWEDLTAAEQADPDNAGLAPTPQDYMFSQFLQSTKSARAEAEADAMELIKAASREHWQAAAWFLERTAPSRFGRRVEVKADVKAEVTDPTAQAAQMSDDERAELLQGMPDA